MKEKQKERGKEIECSVSVLYQFGGKYVLCYYKQ